MNVIIFVIDSLRARNLGCYGYPKNTSPNLGKLAKSEIFFKNSFSASNATEPSLTTILSGYHPLNHGVTHHGPQALEKNRSRLSKGRIRLLQETLRDFKTIAIDWFSGAYTRGFKNLFTGEEKIKSFKIQAGQVLKKIPFLYWIARRLHQRLLGTPKSRATTKKIWTKGRKTMLESEEEFFLLLHSWIPHPPYNPPARHQRKFNRQKYAGGKERICNILGKIGEGLRDYFEEMMEEKEYLSEIWALYDACVRFVDEEVMEFVRWLKKEDLWSETLFILTADHGENLGKDKPMYFNHEGLFDNVMHVPLIIHHPGYSRVEVDSLVSHYDLVPTILDILGRTERVGRKDGKSLIPLIEGTRDYIHDGVYMEGRGSDQRAVRTHRYKFIKNLKTGLKEKYWHLGNDLELYDLRRDPNEEKNIESVERPLREELKRKIELKVREFKTEREKRKIKNKVREVGWISPKFDRPSGSWKAC